MAIVLNDVTSGYNLSTINSNFQKIEDYVNDKLLARADTGVAGEAMMERALDMNGNKILNIFVDVNDANSLLTVGVADSRYYNVSGDTLTGPMDANSQIISNLPSPVQPSQPATKAYADAIQADVDANESRSLRFPDIVSPMAGGVERANSLQGYNNIGTPVPIFSYTDTADLALKLAGTTGASYIGRGGATLEQIIKHSIFEYMTPSDISTITSGTVGTEVNVDYALSAAISAGVMVLEFPWVNGIYVLGGSPATLPLGFSMMGQACRRPYTVSGDSSFNGCGVTIRVASGKTFPFYSTGRHIFRDINFDGRNKSTSYLLYSSSSSTQFNGTRFEGCGIYRFIVALGWNNYTGTLFATRCSISGNADGVKNLIDSSVVACIINANDRGVALLTGANNNSFVDVRNEWNTGDNYYAFNAVENVIVGNLCDRAGRGGVVASGAGSWYVVGVDVRRSGAQQTADTDYSSNFVVIDSGTITISGVRTGTGYNDDGTGTLSPSYCFSSLGSGSGLIIAGASDLSGFITKDFNEKNPIRKNIRGCYGLPDTVNNGLSQSVNGRNALTVSEVTLAASVGASVTATLGNIPPSQFGAYITRTIVVECRLSSGLYDVIKIPVIVRYESSISMDVITSAVFATSGRIALTGATGVNVTPSISADGKTVSVVLTSVDGIQRRANVSLISSI